jgi:PAS domain S-box-containing protein
MQLPRRSATSPADSTEVNVEDRERAATLLAGENRLLRIIAGGAPLGQTFDALCRLVEQISPDWLASILLLDRRGTRVWHGAAPTLPKAYTAALDGVRVSEMHAPFVQAAQGAQVVAFDLAADTRWDSAYRDLALEHGLRACWSIPVRSSTGNVVGIFEVYLRQAGDPSAQHEHTLYPFVDLVRIVVERTHAMPPDAAEEMVRALRRSEERYRRVMEAAGDGYSEWDPETGEFYVSPRLLEICGFPSDATFHDRDEWVRRFPIHPEDRAKWEAMNGKRFADREERFHLEVRIIVRGETRWIAISSVCARDASGRALYWTSSKTDFTERQRATDALLASERRFRQLFENSADILWVHDEQGILVDCNAAACKALGYSREELLKMSVADLVLGQSSEDERRVIWEHAREREPGGMIGIREHELRRKDGTVFSVEVSLGAIEYEGRRLVYASLRDVTDRRSTLEALHHSEARFRSLTELSTDWFWEQDENLLFTYLSNQADNLTGYSGASSLGKKRWELDNMTPLLGSWPDHEAVLAARLPFRDLEVRRVAPDGKVWYLSISGEPIFDRQGRFKGYQGTGRNITESKRIEEELRSRQDMLDLAQKSAGAVPWQWRYDVDPAQNVWSGDLEAMFGVPAQSFEGTSAAWRKLIHPDDWAAVKAAIKRSHETGEIDVEYRVFHPSGAIHWLHQKGRTFMDAEGKPERSIGFMFDVTDKHRSEDELLRLEKQLRLAQRLESMGTLAGGIAHDFNNILGAILGYGEMALRDAAQGSRLRRDLDSIMTAGERGRALIDRILAFSRSGLGEHVAVHVENVVREAIDLLAGKLPEGIHVETNLRAGRAAVLGDPTQVHQVLMNLATNAVQAMPSGGILSVSLEVIRSERRATTIGSVALGEYVVLGVSDTGSGIARHIMDRIFDPFFTTKEVGTGTGLGLSLVHGIVSELGGAIDVASTPGKGSQFTIYLPRNGDATELADPAVSEELPIPRGDGQRLLIVDDEEPLGTFAARALAELGYVPTTYTSSAAALNAFRANPDRYDALITDERMPGLSGTDLIREVRAIRPEIPIMLITGHVGAMVVRRARQAGANEVLKKPLSARELAMSVARVFRGSD